MKLHPILLCALAVPALQAATLVTNNTGYSPAGFQFLDFENQAGTTAVGGIGNMVNNLTGSGTDGDANAFGNQAAYSSGGDVTYNFTELVSGTQYAVYANWYGNGINNCAVDVSLNGTASGTVNQVNRSSLQANGFSAYQDAASADPSTEVYNFVRIGTAFADGNGDVSVVLTKSTTLSFGRYDAVAVSAVPEPSAYGLLGAGALAGIAAIRRRRR